MAEGSAYRTNDGGINLKKARDGEAEVETTADNENTENNDLNSTRSSEDERSKDDKTQEKNSGRGPSACDLCRKRRTRCDMERPSCGKCLTKGHVCKYSLEKIPNGRKNDYILSLEKKIKGLHDILYDKVEPDSQNLTAINEIEFNHLHENFLITPTLDFNFSHLAFPTLDLINGGGNFKPTYNNNNQEGQPAGSQVPFDYCPQPFDNTKVMFDHLIGIYFDKVVRFIDIVYKPKFLELYQLNQCPQVLLLSMCSIASKFSSYFLVLDSREEPAGMQFASVANHLFKQQCERAPNANVIQAGLLLGCYQFMVGKGELAAYYLGITHRAAQYVGLNFVDSVMVYNPNNSAILRWYQLEARRRLWWECLATDTFSSTLVGRPLGIDSRDFVVNLPCDSDFWSPGEDLRNRHFSKLLASLFSIWREVFKFTQHRHLRKWFMNQTVNDQLEGLNKSLSQYYKQLPEELRYKTFTPNVEDQPDLHHCKRAQLHCIFWLIVILLHRSNIAHGISNKKITDSEQFSADQCYEAANHISNVLVDFQGCENLLLDVYTSFAIFNAATIYSNMMHNQRCGPEIMPRLRTMKRYLKVGEEVWRMNNMFLETLKLMEQLFGRRKDSKDDMGIMGWLAPTSTSYLQWYFANVAPGIR